MLLIFLLWGLRRWAVSCEAGLNDVKPADETQTNSDLLSLFGLGNTHTQTAVAVRAFKNDQITLSSQTDCGVCGGLQGEPILTLQQGQSKSWAEQPWKRKVLSPCSK